MLTPYDYRPSQNGYKVRLLFNHLQQPYVTKWVSIFEGEGQCADFLAKSPTGSVPVSRADEAMIPLRRYPAVDAWVSRVRAQEHFLEVMYPYSVDPNSGGELP